MNGDPPLKRDVMGKPLVIRPRPWRQLSTLALLLVATGLLVWIEVGTTGPGRTWGFIGLCVLIYGLYLFESVLIRIRVTPDKVRLISARLVKPVTRAEVAQVRAMRSGTIFYDAHGKLLLNTQVHLTRKQLLSLEDELHVPVWDHRSWYGLRQLENGVRITRDTAGAVPAGGNPAQAGHADPVR